jgi:hypothetical protein
MSTSKCPLHKHAMQFLTDDARAEHDSPSYRARLMRSVDVRFRLTPTNYSLTKADYADYCTRVRELNKIHSSKKIRHLGDCRLRARVSFHI